MASTLISDYQLESEYKVSELREAVFQMRHLSEQSKLDIKRVSNSIDQIPPLQFDIKPLNDIKISSNLLNEK